jgi:hypothetical protein
MENFPKTNSDKNTAAVAFIPTSHAPNRAVGPWYHATHDGDPRRKAGQGTCRRSSLRSSLRSTHRSTAGASFPPPPTFPASGSRLRPPPHPRAPAGALGRAPGIPPVPSTVPPRIPLLPSTTPFAPEFSHRWHPWLRLTAVLEGPRAWGEAPWTPFFPTNGRSPSSRSRHPRFFPTAWAPSAPLYRWHAPSSRPRFSLVLPRLGSLLVPWPAAAAGSRPLSSPALRGRATGQGIEVLQEASSRAFSGSVKRHGAFPSARACV